MLIRQSPCKCAGMAIGIGIMGAGTVTIGVTTTGAGTIGAIATGEAVRSRLRF